MYLEAMSPQQGLNGLSRDEKLDDRRGDNDHQQHGDGDCCGGTHRCRLRQRLGRLEGAGEQLLGLLAFALQERHERLAAVQIKTAVQL
jgi:hypothetical protein